MIKLAWLASHAAALANEQLGGVAAHCMAAAKALPAIPPPTTTMSKSSTAPEGVLSIRASLGTFPLLRLLSVADASIGDACGRRS